MKIQVIILLAVSIFILSLGPAKEPEPLNKPHKEIKYKVVCDTLAYEAAVESCIKDSGADTSSSKTFVKYYTEECVKQNKSIHCNKKKGISVIKGGDEVSWTPCGQVISKKDKKLCE